MTASNLIKMFEGCRLKAYQDQGGVWTCGWGCTGPGIGPDTVWTQEQADDALEHRLAAVEGVILSLLKVAVTENELAAMCSLAWNIGTHAFANSSVLRELNQGRVDAAAESFLLWNKVHGEVNHGLVNRRAAERNVFLAPAPVAGLSPSGSTK